MEEGDGEGQEPGGNILFIIELIMDLGWILNFALYKSHVHSNS